METISLEIKVEKTIDVDVHLSDVIYGINDLPMTRRWNHVANIINQLELDLSNMTDGQKEILKNFLTKKLSLFDNDK
jgi:hypothetical protein